MSFSQKWSDLQKRALLSAVFDHEWKVIEAWRAATAGELPGIGAGLDPFPIPLSTVRDLVSRERHDRNAQRVAGHDPAESIADQSGRLLKLAERALKRAENAEGQKKLKTADLAQLARTVREVHLTARALAASSSNGKGRARGSKDPETTEKPEPGFIDGLAGEVDA